MKTVGGKGRFLSQNGRWRTKVVGSYLRVTDHNRMCSRGAATTTHGVLGFSRQLVYGQNGVNFLIAYNPDILKIVKAYGIKTHRITNQKNLTKELRKVLDYPGPIVCEVMFPVDGRLEPKITAKLLEPVVP